MDRKQMTWGLVLIVVGLAFFLERLDYFSWDLELRRLWPVIPLVLGVGMILWPDKDDSRVGGMWLLVTGSIFMLHNYDVISLHRSWPLWIVAAGVSVIFSSRRKACDRKEGTS